MTAENKAVILFGGKHTRYLQEWAITSDLALVERVMDVRFCSVWAAHKEIQVVRLDTA